MNPQKLAPEVRADVAVSVGRNERVARVKAQIQAGTYETQQKLDQALDRLLAELWDAARPARLAGA